MALVAEDKRFCEECGASISPTAKFCAECGEPVAIGQTKTVRRYQKRERDLVQNFVAVEDRKATLEAALTRYRGYGWRLIGVPSDTKARVYKGKNIRDLSVGIDGTLADVAATRSPQELAAASRANHTARNAVLLVCAGIVIFIGVVAVAGGSGGSSGGARTTPAGDVSNANSVAQTSPSQAQVFYVYRSAITGDLAKLTDSMTAFGTLSSSPRFSDPAWLNQMNTQYTTWHQVYTDVIKLTPPDCLAGIHSRLVNSLAHIDQAATFGEAGDARLDPSLIGQADVEMNQAKSGVSDSLDALKNTQC